MENSKDVGHKYIESLVGSRFGFWTTISPPYFQTNKRERVADVRCDCGSVDTKRLTALRQGLTSDCGRVACSARLNAGLSGAMPVGTKVGRLTVTGIVLKHTTPGMKSKPYTANRCRCACGKHIIVRSSSLKRKVKPTQSCGCIRLQHAGRWY